MEHIHIQMFGAFSLRCGSVVISDANNRSRKVWSLLAYLLCNRNTAISQKKLIELLWGDEPSSSNPENALRITLHRLRIQLDQLWPGAGRDLILHKANGYQWNGQASISLDSDQFEALCRQQDPDEEKRLEICLTALSLYQGEFLDKQSSETWVIPISTHYHNLFVVTTLEAAALLSARARHAEAAQLCRLCIPAEPYHEPLYQMLMKELSAAGDQDGAAAVYENLRKRLFDDFGIHPSEETRAVYRQAVHSPSAKVLPIDEVLEHLQEPEIIPGAMQCDYDYFKVLCHAESRAMERSGSAAHIALLSATNLAGEPLPKRSLERIMEQLGTQIRLNLRRGDTISRCSASQYILMLPKANYEDSCMVCRRVINAYHRAFPHTAVRVKFMVQPLTPGISVP